MARPTNADERPSREARASKRFAALACAFGAAVKASREAQNITRERASALAALDVRHLQRIEAGEGNVTLATVLRLADALGVPVPLLFVAVEVLRQHLARTESKALLHSAKFKANPTYGNIQYASGVAENASNPVPADWSGTDEAISHVGKRISELREARGLTQGQLAKRARLTQQHLQRIESGRQNLTVRSLVRLCMALDTHPAEVFSSAAAVTSAPE